MQKILVNRRFYFQVTQRTSWFLQS